MAPVLTADSVSNTSVTLSWTSGGRERVDYLVHIVRDNSVGCSYMEEDSILIEDGATELVVDAEEDSRYSYSVTASNPVGSSEVSDTLTVMTLTAGETKINTQTCRQVLKLNVC